MTSKFRSLWVGASLLSLGLLNTGFDYVDATYPARCRIEGDADGTFTEIARFDVAHANQGVAVDDHFFYAIDNTTITKHDKKSGAQVAQWQWTGDGKKRNPFIHLDSGVVIDGKLYSAHSNYSDWPEISSLEIWDTRTMKHIGTHSFGIQFGSLTWVDFHDGYWYAMFANYNAEKPHPDPANPNGFDVLPGDEKNRESVQEPYGYKRKTILVKYTPTFQQVEAWVMPDELLTVERTGDMSLSGGSWGPDGSLWITGHDNPEIHKIAFPEAGSKLVLVQTYPLNKGKGDSIDAVSIRGQGIAWDHSQCGVLYGIIRTTDDESAQGVSNKVTVSRFKD